MIFGCFQAILCAEVSTCSDSCVFRSNLTANNERTRPNSDITPEQVAINPANLLPHCLLGKQHSGQQDSGDGSYSH